MARKQRYPIILLHGWGLSGPHYTDAADAFRKRSYIVFTPDFPGFGENEELTEAYTLSAYGSFLENFLKERNIEKCTLIGHSFGGRVAILLAAERPDLVHSLVLTGVPGFPSSSRVKTIPFFIIAKTGKLFFKLPPFSLVAKPARWLLYKFAREKDFYEAKGVMRETFKNVTSHKLIPFMEKIVCPVLLVWGENDTTTPLWIAEKMSKTISAKSKLEVIPEVGHMLPITMPEAFVKHTLAFLKSV